MPCSLRPWRAAVLLALALALPACGPSFDDVRKVDTVEAWEAFLAQTNENSPDYYRAEMRLAEISLDAAREEATPAALDAFTTKFDKPQFQGLLDKAKAMREDVVYGWADEEDSPAAWEQFLKEYPKAKRKRKLEARKRIKMAEHRADVQLGPVIQERINLAEDPEGPLNGWGWHVDVTNVGQKPWYKLNLGLYFLDDAGRVIDRRDWPVVAKFLPGYLPYETGFDKPMEPGETRTWEYTDGDFPEGWAQKVRIIPVSIIYTDDPEALQDEEEAEE
ncbi:MAG: hypothetical protein ABIO70_29670 [Pseudomonadota bacterium]